MTTEFSIIPSVAAPRLLAGGGPTEGPVWHAGGFLTFVRHRMSQLVRWDAATGAHVIRENTGETNGCTLDRNGRLLFCEQANRRVTRQEPDGSIVTIADRYDGKRLNRPCDIVCRSDGMIYFSDPQSATPRLQRELGFPGVFRIAPDGGLHLEDDELGFPNGLAFSPDERTLYVAISRRDGRCVTDEIGGGATCPHRRLKAFTVATDGSLTRGRTFADMSSPGPGGPDGVKCDVQGHVYCTGTGGIWVFDPSGSHLGTIPVPESPVRNLAFGGSDFRTLFICAGDSLYSLEMPIRGIGAW